MNYYSELIIRLLLACLLGGLIGLEREVHNRPAGLRTHILVTVGSALIMLVSIYGFPSGDPARLAAQVVSGIGFLGAGTILRDGNEVSGLTTAASIWVCGGIGLAIGNGFYFGAFFATCIVLFSLFSLGFIENKIFKNKLKKIKIECIERNGLIGELGAIIAKYNICIKEMKFSNNNSINSTNNKIVIKLTLKLPNNLDLTALENDLYDVEGVKKILS